MITPTRTVNWKSLMACREIIEAFANGKMSARNVTEAFKNTQHAGEFRYLIRSHGVDQARVLARRALRRR